MTFDEYFAEHWRPAHTVGDDMYQCLQHAWKAAIASESTPAGKPWSEYWYVTDCCKMSALCPEHRLKHQNACGSKRGNRCDVCAAQPKVMS